MNGKLARRIRRAAWQVLHAGTGMAPSKGDTHREIVKTLKREYRALPYHKRKHYEFGYRILSHREQECRWLYCSR